MGLSVLTFINANTHSMDNQNILTRILLTKRKSSHFDHQRLLKKSKILTKAVSQREWAAIKIQSAFRGWKERGEIEDWLYGLRVYEKRRREFLLREGLIDKFEDFSITN